MRMAVARSISQANAPILDALFADSVATGRRSQLYTLLHIAYITSQVGRCGCYRCR
jgi:hypothetical protein